MAREDPLKPRKRPIQARARHTVEALLEGAAQVFEKLGYAQTTTDRIAQRAGVSVGSLYQYFPGKDAILVALAERHADESLAMVRRKLGAEAPEPLEDLPLETILYDFLQALIALHRRRPRLQRMLFVEAPKPAGFVEAISAQEDALAVHLRGLLQRHPDVHTRDPELCVYVLMHVAEGLIHDYILHPPPGDVSEERFTAELVRLLFGYLCFQDG